MATHPSTRQCSYSPSWEPHISQRNKVENLTSHKEIKCRIASYTIVTVMYGERRQKAERGGGEVHVTYWKNPAMCKWGNCGNSFILGNCNNSFILTTKFFAWRWQWSRQGFDLITVYTWFLYTSPWTTLNFIAGLQIYIIYIRFVGLDVCTIKEEDGEFLPELYTKND
jgi:hypothetical protein